MPRNDSTPSRDPEDRRSSGGALPQGERAGGAGMRRGRSGYGMESIRPHLRAQLEQRKLLRPTFPPEDPEENNSKRPSSADS